MTEAKSFPLGDPINRKPQPAMTPVPGRPGWFTDAKHSEPFYIEPPRPNQWFPAIWNRALNR